MSRKSSLDSRGFPVAIRKSGHKDLPWSSVRAEEVFEMGDREYKILKDTSGAVEWKGMIWNCLKLPGEEFWHIIVTLSVICMFMLALCCIFFAPDRLFVFLPFYIICDLIYLTDFLLNLLHYFWKNLRRKFHLKVKRGCVLMLDFISLLPQEVILGTILGYKHWSVRYSRCVTFIRLYQIFKLFGEILRSFKANRRRWLILQYVILYIMVLHTLVCIWYKMGKVGDTTNNAQWSVVFISNASSIYNWYLSCFYITLTLMTNTGFGDYYPVSMNEALFCTLIMTTGFLFLIALIAILTVQLINLNYRRTKFFYELENTKDALRQINVSPDMTKQVLDYYKVLWINKNGIERAPAFDTLPASLRMELMYDINISYLQRSLLLKHHQEAFLRKISLLAKHVFLLPGDNVFHQGVVKNKLIFVISGVVEILSDEDDQSPIISFRAGTVLGEASLLMTLPAKTTVRAATYVELQVIERQDFIRMMLDHPDVMAQFKGTIAERLRKAGSDRATDDGRVTMNLLVSNVQEFRPIKLLKQHLSKSKHKALRFSDRASTSSSEANFNEDCLPLYKLAPNVTMIEQTKICMPGSFPWILRPNSTLVHQWNNLVNLSQVLLCILLPYYVVYERRLPHYATLYCYMADVIYLLDIFVCCSTAVEFRNRKIKKFKDISDYRMQHLSFYVDVFSLFPIEVMTFAMDLPPDKQNRWFYLFKLNRVLRIRRLKNIMALFDKTIYPNVMVSILVRQTVYVVLAVFGVGAVLYLESCMFPICVKSNWFYVQMVLDIRSKSIAPCYENVVAVCTYFATMALLLVGCGDIVPNSQMDVMLVCALELIGYFMICSCAAKICSTFALHDRFASDFQDNIFAFRKFLEQNNLPRSLHKRITNFFCLQWNYNRGTGREYLMKSAPPPLRSALKTAELKSALSEVPLFSMVDIDFLLIVAEGAKVQVLPPDEIIAYSGDVSREMHIVLSGHCQVLRDPEAPESCGPGAQFGVLEMIYGIPKRYTTKTVTNCRIISVDYKTYIQAISMFPTILRETKEVMDQEDLVGWVQKVDLERTRARASKMGKAAHAKNICKFINHFCAFFRKSFIFTWYNCRTSRGKETYWAPFAKMNRFQYLGYLLLPLTIHPEGPFLKIWYIIRIISIMVFCIVGPFYIALIPYTNDLYWVMLVTYVCAYVDMYLLMHVAYYNDKGLLISHPKLTAAHYFTHSFLLDLLSTFPLSLFVIWEDPRHNEGHDRITDIISPHITHCSWYLNSLLQFHRIYEMFKYIEKDISMRVTVIRFFKLVPFTLVLINLLTSIVFHMSCQYTFYDTFQNGSSSSLIVYKTLRQNYYGYFSCMNGSWLDKSQFTNFKDPLKVYLIGFYWMTSTVLSVGIGDVSTSVRFGLYLIIFAVIFGRLIFSYVYASLAIGRAKLSMVQSQYQENLKNLMQFLKYESVDPYWRSKAYLYFKNVWDRTSGVESQELCRKLNTALMEDTMIALYEKTLREVPLFESVEKSFIRVIAKHLTKEYFFKGDTIVRSFDVQNNIYIIHRGKVEVLSFYHEMIACMGPGGLFGNIRQVSSGCSSVSVVASRDLDVLVVSSETFYGVIKDYPRLKRNMDALLQTVTDYIMPTTIIDDDDGDASNTYTPNASLGSSADRNASEGLSSTGDRSSQATPSRSFQSISVRSQLRAGEQKSKPKDLKVIFNFCLPYKWFKFAIRPDHTVVKITSIAVLIVSYYDFLVVLYCFVTQNNNQIFLYCTLFLESVFYFKIFLNFHVAYLDRHGNYIARFRKISRRYFSNATRVCWDVIPNIPVEPLCFLFAPESRFLALSSLRLIHLLRIIYIFDYFRELNRNLMINISLNQLLRMFIFLSIALHVFTCGWLMLACPFDRCLENSWIRKTNITMRNTEDLYFVSLYYTVSLSTATGVGDIYPVTVLEIVFSIAVMLINRFLKSLVIGDIVSIINIASKSLILYEERISCLKDFLQNQNLSGHQMEKLWGYVRNLWEQERGQHTPVLLQACPYVLRCDITNSMFGHHFRNSFLFQGLNDALLRQLAAKLQRVVFFKGNYIVQDGDIDQNMYFIHHGEVSVLTVHANLTETQHELLKTDDMFGLAQGLHRGLPHKFSFRANTKASILVLNLDSWHHMLKYFPVDEDIIYSRAQAVYIKV